MKAHKRLVEEIAGECGAGHPDLMNDLIRAGTQGLMKAIATFDSTRGVGLADYARFWIYSGMWESMATDASGWRGLPLDVQARLLGAIDRESRAQPATRRKTGSF